jgi:hypothetical protein
MKTNKRIGRTVIENPYETLPLGGLINIIIKIDAEKESCDVE